MSDQSSTAGFPTQPGLTLPMRYRLVEIAHDGRPEVAEWAVDTLRRAAVIPISLMPTGPEPAAYSSSAPLPEPHASLAKLVKQTAEAMPGPTDATS